ncbi:MAG: efflux RND transporter permease subunit [Deltaproteobacteria bacterium]|nr:efflux RND transporter permease subunit [Deltaproteobacteria bacterium]
MARNTVAANLLMLVLLVGGYLVSGRIKQEVFPEFQLDWVMVQVAYPGASPEEVEKGIVLAIEEQVRGLDGVKQVVSSASEGSGNVYVELLLGTSPEKALSDIKTAVDRVTSLPEDAERPVVSLLSNRKNVVSVALYGDLDEKGLKELAEQLRDQILTDPRVTQVELSGTRPTEISIEVPGERLRKYGLTLDAVAAAVRREAVQVPAGQVKTAGGEVLLRTDERRELGHEFENIPVLTTRDGATVTVGQLATVEDGFQDVDRYATFQGQRAVLIDVYRVGEETPIAVADAVREKLDAFESRLPPGLHVAVTSDDSEMYRDRIDLLMRNALFGLILVFVTLGLFLKLQLSFWVTLGIPVSFLGTMMLMPATGVSINMISLFAFIVTLGIVVDDAIVVGENVYEYRQRGMSMMEAAIRGAQAVAVPVTFSVLTTVVAFMPLFFVPGFMGKLFGVIPAVVVCVLLMSLVESLFILPSHLAHQFSPPRRGLLRAGWIVLMVPLAILRPFAWSFEQLRIAFSGALAWFIARIYAPSVAFAVRERYLTLAVGVATLAVVVGLIAGGRVDFAFMPRLESDNVRASAALPFGTPVEETQAVQQRLIDGLRETLEELGGEDKLSRGIYAVIGQGISDGGPGGGVRGIPGGHVTNVRLRMVPSADRPGVTASRLVDLWRSKVGDIPGVEALTFKSNMGPSAGSPIDVQLSHRDVAVLEQAATELAGKLRSYAGVYDLDTGFSEGKPQLDLTLTPLAEASGVTATDIARQVRGAFYGSEALRQQRGRDELRVFVRRPESERRSEHDIESFIIRTPSGADLPLADAAHIERGHAATSIGRADGRRVIHVTGEVDLAVNNPTKIAASIEKDLLPQLREHYPDLSWSMEGEQREQRESLQALGRGFTLAMFVIFAMLAVVFRSYIQPIVVMAAIPFGIVGAVMGHVLMGFELSIMSMMGIVALSGVVVNDSLVMVHAANEFRDDEGLAPHDAIQAAGIRRFRPILLTSLTTFFGLMPMILETSMQARFLVPMALSLGFGVVFATFITLVLVPAFYTIVEDFRRALGMRRPPRAGEDAPRPEDAAGPDELEAGTPSDPVAV